MTRRIAGCFPGAYLALAIALTAQSPDEAGDDLTRGPCEMPRDAAGRDGRPVGQQDRRTAPESTMPGCQSGAAREAGEAGRGRGKGPAVRGR